MPKGGEVIMSSRLGKSSKGLEQLEAVRDRLVHSVTALNADDAVDLDQAIMAVNRMIDRRS